MSRSPYSAPEATLHVDNDELVPGPPLAQIDLMAALKWPTATSGWWKSCLVAGLWWMVPVIGWVALTGWARRIHHQVRSGSPGQFPPLDLGPDLGRGWGPTFATVATMMVAMSLVIVVVGGSMIVARMAADASGSAGSAVFALVFLIGQIAYIGMLLAFNVYMLELSRLAYAGSLFPLARLVETARVVRANPGAYVVASVGVFVAGMAMSMGVYACFIGMLVTFPWGFAVMAHLSGQWARVAETPTSAPAPATGV